MQLLITVEVNIIVAKDAKRTTTGPVDTSFQNSIQTRSTTGFWRQTEPMWGSSERTEFLYTLGSQTPLQHGPLVLQLSAINKSSTFGEIFVIIVAD